jgi:hypothetical protein
VLFMDTIGIYRKLHRTHINTSCDNLQSFFMKKDGNYIKLPLGSRYAFSSESEGVMPCTGVCAEPSDYAV